MSGTRTPEPIREQVLIFHAQSLQPWQIERETGLSLNTIKRIIDPDWADNARARDREWKRNHRPYCDNCGDPCRGRCCQRCYLLKRTIGEQTGKTPKKVLDFVARNGEVSSRQIQEGLGLNARTLHNATYLLVKRGRLKRVKRGIFTV